MADPKQNQKHEVIKTLKEPKKTCLPFVFFLVNSFCKQHAHELSQNNNTVLL